MQTQKMRGSSRKGRGENGGMDEGVALNMRQFPGNEELGQFLQLDLSAISASLRGNSRRRFIPDADSAN
jgi:hypothetical protein